MQPLKLYIGLMLVFLVALLVGAFLFFTGMNSNSYLTSDGVQFLLRFIDKPRYESNLLGFVYALTFLTAGALFLLLVLLPNEALYAEAAVPTPAPQRARRAPPAPAAPQRVATQRAAPAIQAPPEPPPAAGAPTVAIDESGDPQAEDDDAEPSVEAELASEIEPTEVKSIEEEVLTAKVEDDLPLQDLPDSRYEDTEEENIVYGNGPVTDDSIFEFIQTYPDSAVKFLYRKTLENKPLLPTDEDIYRRWEIRGMTRAKVRGLVLAMMKWKSLPDDYPHNIWRQLRDEIFEMQTRT